MSGDKIAGFARYDASRGGGPFDGGWIRSLHVYPLYRGLGIGGMLLDRLVSSAAARGGRELRVDLAEDNRRCIGLCMKKGFVRESGSELGTGAEGNLIMILAMTPTMPV